MKQELLIEDWDFPNDQLTESTGFDGKLFESRVGNDNQMYIEGIFMQAERLNGNKRKYPKSVLEKAVNRYMREQVEQNQALGELNHPNRPFVDPDKAAIRITDLWWEGNNVMGKAIVLDTEKGKNLKGLLKGGWKAGVSTRGLGSVKKINGVQVVQEGYRLTVGVDVVWGPSAQDAFVRTIQEHQYDDHDKNSIINNSVDDSNIVENHQVIFEKIQRNLKKLL